jgi:hypothetical protein
VNWVKRSGGRGDLDHGLDLTGRLGGPVLHLISILPEDDLSVGLSVLVMAKRVYEHGRP